MLNTLGRICSGSERRAKDLITALDIIVQRVREAMGTEVCFRLLLDPDSSRYVLMATEV